MHGAVATLRYEGPIATEMYVSDVVSDVLRYATL
jgi:hypothetical protein